MPSIVISDTSIRQDARGRFNLNDLHRAAGGGEKHSPNRWTRSEGYKGLIGVLTPKMAFAPAVSRRGGKVPGTFVCKELVYAYAMWISPEFSLEVIQTFDKAVQGQIDWKFLRSAAASSAKVANDILKMTRQEAGKDTASHHYSNEARMVNSILSGEYKGLDRNSLSSDQLALLTYLQERNAVLIGRGLSYQQRKELLPQYAMDFQVSRSLRIAEPTPKEPANV